MKIKLVVEDKNKGKLEIPLSINQVRDIYDVGYLIDAHCWKDIKANKTDKSWEAFHEKLSHLIHDIIDEGRAYIPDKKGVKFKLLKERQYVVRKPKWKK